MSASTSILLQLETDLISCCLPPRSSAHAGAQVRVERIDDDLDFSEASSLVTDFYAKKSRLNNGETASDVGEASEFPPHVMLALAYLIRHLDSQFSFLLFIRSALG